MDARPRLPMMLTNRKRTILALRVVLAFAALTTSAAEDSLGALPAQYLAILAVYVVSTLAFSCLAPARFAQPRPVAAIFLFDLLVLTTLFLHDPRVTQDFYVLLYVIVLMAALTRSVGTSLAIAVAGGALYWTLSSAGVTGTVPLSATFNARLVFLFVMATFATFMASELRAAAFAGREAFERFLQKSVEGLILCDPSGRVLRANPVALRLLGRTESRVTGQPADGVLGGAKPLPYEVHRERIQLEGENYQLVYLHDLSEVRKLEAALQRMERLSALGGLVAGLTHQMNNSLTGTIGFSQLLEQHLKDPQTQAWARAALESATRTREVLRAFLDMARGREFKPVPTRVNQILDRASALVADAVRLSQTELIVRRDPADSTLMADPLKLEEALLNLVHNSIDAMRGSENRHLTLSAETAPPFVRIAVKDTGTGILPAHRERIFEPFFTTKGPEEGTGLGLAICKALVALHGGQIDVDSELGRGSTFTITLPLPANGAPPAR